MGVLFLVLPFMFQGFTQEGWREFFSNLSTILLLLSAGIGGLLLMPHFRRRTHLYDAAFSSSPLDNAPMATNQPMSNEMAFVLPTTIRLRIRWPAALMWHLLFLLVVMAVASGFTIGDTVLRERLTGIPPESRFITISTIGFIGVICILAMLTAVILLPYRLQTVRIMDEGVIQVKTGRASAVAWKDVRVFALVEGGKHPGSAASYLLSSGSKSVRWTHRSRTRWYSITAPNTSDEEYQRQMEALLSYAAARTGLPLLDLR